MLKILASALLLVAAAPLIAQDGQKLQPPQVKLVRQNTDLAFEMTNPNAVPLPYLGNRADSFTPPLAAGTIAPFYLVEIRSGYEWKSKTVGWCKTGIGEVSVPAKGKATFLVTPPDGDWEEMRVGVSWYETGDRKGVRQIAWSAPVKW